MRSSGLIRVPAAAMSVPSGVRMSRATVMDGIEQAAAFLHGGRDARHGIRLFQLRPGALAGLPVQTGQLAGPFHLDEAGLDLRQQVRLGDRPGRAAHAEILRRRWRCRGKRQGDGKGSGGERPEGRAAVRPGHGLALVGGPDRASSSSRAGGGVSAGCGRTTDGPASSGPASGPFSPSQGMSGRATARPRIRPRGTRPISA